MSIELSRFNEIAASIPDTSQSKMFGALCVKAPNGKAGVMFYQNTMIFKLQGVDYDEAMKLTDARVFAPGGRPMKGWIQLDYIHESLWHQYALKAMSWVGNIEVVKKEKKI